MMKIVVASDSYKGSLTSNEVCDCIEKGIKKASPLAEVIKVPMADGGEGTARSLLQCIGGRNVEVKVKDPLCREITAEYGILADNKTAVIEMAAASGLPLLKSHEKFPLITTTYGTGELVKDALEKGCENFIIAIGGSATNDGGAGMMMALGCNFLDRHGNSIGLGGANLSNLYKIDISNMDKRLLNCKITAACDVENILCGENGASYVFGPQKGASKTDIEILDKALLNFARVIKEDLKKDVLNIPGGGAAGGLGAGLMAFLNANLKRGIDIVMETSALEKKIQGADLVITGEGRMDYQTQFGKAPYGVAMAAKKYNIPVIGICGSIGDRAEELYKYFTSIFSIMEGPITLEEAILKSPLMIENLAERIIRLLNESWNDMHEEGRC